MNGHDAAFMRAALALARRGLGRTAPNPAVGALVVDERHDPPRVLGRGVTAPSGRPHAEAIALAQAGAGARGATIYVTLESCATRSSQANGISCSDAILAAGVARVVVAAADPSSNAKGQGLARLRAAGVVVVEDVLGAQAEAFNRGHIARVTLGRPCTFLKLAQTADGFAASETGQALTITGEESRRFVHRLRAGADVILTGIGTVLADDPRLDCRLPGMAEYSPARIVLDSTGRFPATARMLETAARTAVIIATAEPARVLARLGQRAGVEVLAVPRGSDGHLNLAALLAALGARGITRAMVEAGPRLAEAFARSGLLDEALLFTAPHAIGRGLVAIGPALARWLADATLVETRWSGADALQRYARA